MIAFREVRRFAWSLARPLAMQLMRYNGTIDVEWRRLSRLRKLGIDVRLAVDGGAATGEWTRRFKRIYPHAAVLCVEPREEAQEALARASRRLSGITLAACLLGDRNEDVEFNAHEEQTSLFENAKGDRFGTRRRAPMVTLDSLVEQKGLAWPDLIKLDLQGAELLCLQGASECLKHAKVVLLEVLLLPLYQGSPKLAEVVAFMEQAGFVVYDILSLWHRPLDGALAFSDLLFVRCDSPLIADGRWSTRAKWEGDHR